MILVGFKLNKQKKNIKNKLNSIKKELASFNFDSRDREKLIDLYSYQINEIEEANFKVGEEESLKEFRVRVLNQEKIALSLERLNSFFEGAGENYGILGLIKRADIEIADVMKYMPESSEIAERINSFLFPNSTSSPPVLFLALFGLKCQPQTYSTPISKKIKGFAVLFT